VKKQGIRHRNRAHAFTYSLCFQISQDLFTIWIGSFWGQILADDSNDDNLQRGHTRRHDKTLIISVHHDHDTNGTSGQAPRCLPRNLTVPLLILILDIEHFAKVLAKVVGSSALNGSSRTSNICLHSGSLITSGEFFLFSLVSRNDRDTKKILIHSLIKLQGLHDHRIGVFERSMSSVTFLPQKLTRSQKGGWKFELPSNNVTPLVELQRKISVRFDPIRKSRIHDSLRSRTDSNRLG
jgi:hypothetical protein